MPGSESSPAIENILALTFKQPPYLPPCRSTAIRARKANHINKPELRERFLSKRSMVFLRLPTLPPLFATCRDFSRSQGPGNELFGRHLFAVSLLPYLSTTLLNSILFLKFAAMLANGLEGR